MRDLEKVIGRVVAVRRKRLGLSQEALAEATCLHLTYISLVERGLRCPSTRVLMSLAMGLDTKGSYLLSAIERGLTKTIKTASTSRKTKTDN